MPKYFFHVDDHKRFPDEEGTVLPDLDAARVEAVRVSGELLKEHAEEFWASGEWQVVVADADQTILFTLRFQARPEPQPAQKYQLAARGLRSTG